jgi:hypothetical protein
MSTLSLINAKSASALFPVFTFIARSLVACTLDYFISAPENNTFAFCSPSPISRVMVPSWRTCGQDRYRAAEIAQNGWNGTSLLISLPMWKDPLVAVNHTPPLGAKVDIVNHLPVDGNAPSEVEKASLSLRVNLRTNRTSLFLFPLFLHFFPHHSHLICSAYLVHLTLEFLINAFVFYNVVV